MEIETGQTPHESPPGREPVSLIMTIYNERGSVERFFQDVARFTRLPDEIVIVDGGSNDGTVEIVKARIPDCPVPVNFIEEHRCNIPRGRNLAVQHARHDLIAITDMGCIVAEDWLERILAPFEADASVDVVGGYYEPIRTLPIQDCYHYLTYKPRLEKSHFLPSSRSLVIRRRVFDAVGGYPEYISTAEDTLFDLRIRERGFNEVFAPEAKVYWEIKTSCVQFFVQYYRYARGAGRALIQPRLYGFYMANYTLFLCWTIIALTSFPVAWIILAAHLAAYSYYRVFRKPLARSHLSPGNLARYAGITAAIDLGHILGYWAGLGERILGIDERWKPARDKNR
ncbi:MAG: hypothetical protein QG656_1602 [Candidatus Hydrogenedentes bacterium]|nr:hypothetical protein [Candidatus Hydrogenedentota bacterium]